MNAQMEYHNQEVSYRIKSLLSTKKKNIVILCLYDTYRMQYGDLIHKLKEKYNVILVATQRLNDELERIVGDVVVAYWRFNDNGVIKYNYLNIEGIDLIITTDEVGYDDGKIDREFLSKSAKRMLMPHSLLLPVSASAKFIDYVIVPTKISLDGYIKSKMDSKLLECGYPKLDLAISKYKYESKNIISYVPTLKFVDNNTKELNLVAGFECAVLEWLLCNTQYIINYRAHPMNSQNNHIFYAMVKKKYINNKRIIFDATSNSDFFNFSDFIITDYSTSAFTYSFSTLRPSFCITPYRQDTVFDKNLDRIGGVVSNFVELKELIYNIDFEKYSYEIENFRNEILFNPLHSSEAIVKEIDRIFQGDI